MSRSERILSIIAVVWLALWFGGAYLFFRGAADHRAEAEYLGQPLTPIARGSEVRAEGTIEDGLVVAAPFTRTACVAAEARLYYVTAYEDSQDKTHHEARLVAARRTGPREIGILIDGTHLALPLDRWTPARSGSNVSSHIVEEVPAELAVSEEELRDAKAGARGRFEHYAVDETVLPGGTHVFVAGRVSASDGPPVLEVDPSIGRVELYLGTQAALVEGLRGSSTGLRIAGWVFGGVGILPLLILGVLVTRRRSRPAKLPRPSTDSGLPVDDRRE